jgi:arylformamidase
MDLSYYYGPCRVVSFPENTLLTQKDLEGRIEDCERLVIHGGGNTYFSREGAEYIVSKGIRTVVTDALSVAPVKNEAEIHMIIMSAEIAVVENVILDFVTDGEYTLCAFPTKFGNCDGAPVRAVLISY